MRFHTTHLMGFVALAALALCVARHPETLWAAVVPLIAGIFVVLPALGVAELFAARSQYCTEIGWGGSVAAVVAALVGSVIAVIVLFGLLTVFG